MSGGTLEIPADLRGGVDPEDTFPPMKIRLLDVPYANFIAASARANGVAPELVASVIAKRGIQLQSESGVLAVRMQGLMQLLPQTAKRFGVSNIFDPQQNIEAGTKYLKELLHALATAIWPSRSPPTTPAPIASNIIATSPPTAKRATTIRKVTQKIQETYRAATQTLDLQ